MNTPLADREAVMNIRLAMDREALTEDAYREALRWCLTRSSSEYPSAAVASWLRSARVWRTRHRA